MLNSHGAHENLKRNHVRPWSGKPLVTHKLEISFCVCYFKKFFLFFTEAEPMKSRITFKIADGSFSTVVFEVTTVLLLI